MSATPPPLSDAAPPSSSTTPAALIVVLWIAWIVVLLVADFFAFMMVAFADSPSSGNAAKLLIVPLFAWFALTFAAGVALLMFRGAWQVPLAFALAMSPPFLMFAGYNLLADSSGTTVTVPTGPTATPPPTRNVPPGGFRPPVSPTSQPNFLDAIRRATTRAREER